MKSPLSVKSRANNERKKHKAEFFISTIIFATTVMGIIFVIAIMTMLTGCESETLVTGKGESSSTQLSSIHQGTSSNMGSLTNDSIYDPPSVPETIIKPGDQVQVMVWGYPQFNTTTTVKNYGTISIPLIGDVIAEGLTENQLAGELKQRLSEYVKGDTRVTISHVSMDNLISVMGAVNKQGNYTVLGEKSLVEIIADAGGTVSDADLRHVKIFRGGNAKNAEEINLQRLLENGNLGNAPKVKPGDTVFVPAEENLIKEIAGYGQQLLLLFGFFALLR